MWLLVIHFWFGAALTWLNFEDVLAKDNRYSRIFSKMEDDLYNMRNITDPQEIRRRHLATMEAYRDVSVSPCQGLLEYACGKHFADIGVEGDDLTVMEYDDQMVRYQELIAVVSDYTTFKNGAERNAKTFFNSCLYFDASVEDLNSIAKELYSIVDAAQDWSEAYADLFRFGIQPFFSVSLENGIHVRALYDQFNHIPRFELGKHFHLFWAISSDSNRNVYRVMQDLLVFYGVLKGEGRVGRNATYEWTAFKETFPSIHLDTIIRSLYGSFDKEVKIEVHGVSYMSVLNSLFKEERYGETIRDVLKIMITDVLMDHAEYFNVAPNPKSERCFDATRIYFQPGLMSLYRRHYIPDDAVRDISHIVQAIVKEQEDSVINSHREKAILSGVEDTLKFILGPLYDNSDVLNNYNGNLKLDSSKEFLELYMHTLNSHNTKNLECFSHSRKELGDDPLSDNIREYDVCGQRRTSSPIPISYFNIPHYHIDYPKFWNYASLSYALLSHIFKPAEYGDHPGHLTASFDWSSVIRAYQKWLSLFTNETDLADYQNLNLTTSQAFYVAFLQTVCNQVRGPQMDLYSALIKNPQIASIFNC